MDFQNKTKTKIIALLSSIVLWIYVTTVVDPLESRTFKDIPISISNSHLITEKNLEVFPRETISANITVKTNLSKLKKLTKDNIAIYGTINNPVPGKNILNLSSNLPDSIRYDIKPNVATVNLEPLETIEKEITVIANKKYTTDKYKITIDKERIELSGAKTLVNKVDKIIGTIKTVENEDSFSEKIELIPTDRDGNKVEGVKLSDKYINVNIEKVITEPVLDPNIQTVEQEKDTQQQNNQEKK